MYTRYPSIASILQKAVLLKDGKCNKIIQRRLCSESFGKLSKVEYKLRPMKRYFSGAANNRNSGHRTRNLQGVGFVRKNLPNFPREMVQQQPPIQVQNIQENVDGSTKSLSGQFLNGNAQKSGKITIVIDKNEICNCSSPNEDVQIHITTTPETTQTKRLVKALSESHMAEACSTKCNCCPQCEPMKNARIQQSIPITSNLRAFQPPRNLMNFPNNFPRREQNVYGLPLRNFSVPNEGGPSKMQAFNLKKSRSTSYFPVMRKMIVPNRFDQQQESRQLSSTSIQSPSNFNRHSGSNGNKQPSTLQRTNAPNTIQTQRNFSLHSQPQQMHRQPQQYPTIPVLPYPSTEQPKSCNVVFQRPNQEQMKALGVERNATKLDDLNRQLRKYSSFDQNDISVNLPVNKSNPKQSKQQKVDHDIGRTGSKPVKPTQPRRIVERVLRPATFSTTPASLINLNRSNIASALNGPLNRKLSSAPVPNQHRNGHVSSFNPQETASRNRFPADRGSLPRLFTSRSQDVMNAVQKNHADNVSKNIISAGLRNRLTIPRLMLNASQGNVLPNKAQRSVSSVSHGNSIIPRLMVNQKQFSVQRPLPPMIVRKKSEMQPLFNRNHLIQNYQPPRMFVQPNSNIRRPTTQRHPMPMQVNQMKNLVQMKQPPHQYLRERRALQRVPVRQLNRKLSVMPMRGNRPNNVGQMRQPPQFLLRKGRAIRPTVNPHSQQINRQSSQMPMRANRMNNLVQMKQPPRFFLRKGRGLPPTVNQHRQINRSSSQRQRSHSITQRNHHQRNVNSNRKSFHTERPNCRNSPTLTMTQSSMLPVRNTNQVQQTTSLYNLSQQNPPPFRKISIVPFESLVNSTQPKNQPQSQPIRSTKQPNSMRINQTEQPDNARRINEARFQSSLPVKVTSQPNQIGKYVEIPKSLQTVRRPHANPARNQSLRMQPVPQMTPTYTQKSLLPPTSANLQDKFKKSPTKSSQLAPIATNADKFKLKSNNPAVLFYGPGKLRLVNIPVPRLTDDKGVIVKMMYVHLTDTDAQMLSALQDGPNKLTQPTIAGKSGSGVIVDVGKQVENVKVGDKVSVKGISCGKCTACINDNENICERVPMTEKLGIMKRYHAVPEKFVTKLPDAVHPIDGSMIDELSSSIRACKKSSVTAGDNVLVVGGKSIALWTCIAAKRMGATNVCLADSNPKVLEQAKKLGIEHVFLIKPDASATNTSKSIVQCLDGESPRIVFDCCGSPLTNEIAINTALIGGKVVLMKNSLSNRPIFLSDAVDRGIDILSSQHGNNDSERAALQFLSSGKVQLHGIDSSFYDITNVHDAFDMLISGTNSNIFIQPSRSDDDGVSDGKKKSKNS